MQNTYSTIVGMNSEYSISHLSMGLCNNEIISGTGNTIAKIVAVILIILIISSCIL